MKKRCPKCGTWCEPQKRSIIQKAGDGFAKTKDSFAKFGEGIGEKIGGKDGGTVGKIVGAEEQTQVKLVSIIIFPIRLLKGPVLSEQVLKQDVA